MVAVAVVPVVLQAVGWIVCFSAMQVGGVLAVVGASTSAAGKSSCHASGGTNSEAFHVPCEMDRQSAANHQGYFRPDNVYAYSYVYSASLPNRRGSKAERESNGIRVQCHLRVESFQSGILALQIKNCTIYEQLQREGQDIFEVNSKSESFSKQMSAFPLEFVTLDGSAAELRSSARESAAILNFKRGILATLLARQTPTPEHLQWETREDIQGVCQVRYSVDDKNRILLTKDQNSCQLSTNGKSRSSNSFASLWNKSFVDFFGVTSSSRCTYDFQISGELSETNCEESHFRVAASRTPLLITSQLLTLSGVSALKNITGYDVSEYRKVSAHYDHDHHRHGAPSNNLNDEGFSSSKTGLLGTLLSVGSQFLGDFQDGGIPLVTANAAITNLLPLMAGVGRVDTTALHTLASGLDEATLQSIIATGSALPIEAWADLLSIASTLTTGDDRSDPMHNWLPSNQHKNSGGDQETVIKLLDADQVVVSLAGVPINWSAETKLRYLAQNNSTNTEDAVKNHGFRNYFNISGEISFVNRIEVAISKMANIGTETITYWSTSVGAMMDLMSTLGDEIINFRLQLPVRELKVLTLREKESVIRNFVTEQMNPRLGGMFSGADGELWCTYVTVPLSGKRICVSGSDPSATFTDFLPFVSDSSTSSWELTLQHLLPDPVVFRMQINNNESAKPDTNNISSIFLHILGADVEDGTVHLTRINTLLSQKLDMRVNLPHVARFNATTVTKHGDNVRGLSVKFSVSPTSTFFIGYSAISNSSLGSASKTTVDELVHKVDVTTPFVSFSAEGYHQTDDTFIRLQKYPATAATDCDAASSPKLPQVSLSLNVNTKTGNKNRIAHNTTGKYVTAKAVLGYSRNSESAHAGNQNVTILANLGFKNSSFKLKLLLESSEFKHSISANNTYVRYPDGFHLQHHLRLIDQLTNRQPVASYDLELTRTTSKAPLRLNHTFSTEFYRFTSALLMNSVSELLDLDMNVTTRSQFWKMLNMDLRQLVSAGQETMNMTSSLVDISVVADWRNKYSKTFTFKSKNVDLIPNMIWQMDIEGLHKGEIVIRMLDSSINFYILNEVTNINPFTFSLTVCVQERCSHPQIDLVSFLIRWTITLGEPDCLNLNTTANYKLGNEAKHILDMTVMKFGVLLNKVIDDKKHPVNSMFSKYFGSSLREQLPILKEYVNYMTNNIMDIGDKLRAAYISTLQFLRAPPVSATCHDLYQSAKQIAKLLS